MDQQAALRWVKQNITKFGGDPGDIGLVDTDALLDDRAELLLDPVDDGHLLQRRAGVRETSSSLYVPFCRSAVHDRAPTWQLHGRGAKVPPRKVHASSHEVGLPRSTPINEIADPPDRDPQGEWSDQGVGHLEETEGRSGGCLIAFAIAAPAIPPSRPRSCPSRCRPTRSAWARTPTSARARRRTWRRRSRRSTDHNTTE